MNDELENAEAMVIKFVEDFFSTYDKNRHIFHKLFSDNGCFNTLGNRFTGQLAIEQAILTMATTAHHILSIDVQSLSLHSLGLPDNIFTYQVLCAGEIEFGTDPELYGFTATFLVYFQKPNILNVITFNERSLWPHL